jgi:hypothetical protein
MNSVPITIHNHQSLTFDMAFAPFFAVAIASFQLHLFFSGLRVRR